MVEEYSGEKELLIEVVVFESYFPPQNFPPNTSPSLFNLFYHFIKMTA